ncbi:NAD(P)-dependent oxidoreductase [Enterobacter roggenkampii]|nr:NAD(P)-dependent oxidoreductase [Enterobacter roggenkampii]
MHVSTDYVFDGTSTVPYIEEDIVKSLNVYGSTKRKGELGKVRTSP